MPKIAFIKTKYYHDYDDCGTTIITPYEWEDISDEELEDIRRLGSVIQYNGYSYYIVEQISLHDFKIVAKDLIEMAKKARQRYEERLEKNRIKREKAEKTRAAKQEERERKKFEALKAKFESKKD